MKTLLLLGLLGLLGSAYSEGPKANSGDAAGRTALRKDIFRDYDKLTIPDNVKVQFGFALLNLDVDEDNDFLNVDTWLQHSWEDSRLAWNTSVHDIDVIRVGSDEIWKPDITLYNSANLKDMLSCWKSNAIIYSNGKVLWVPPCQIRSHCNITLDRQPFGDQICSFKFGSWTYDVDLINIEMMEPKKSIDLDNFGSTHWKVVKSSAERHETVYPCCPEAYVDITYDLTFKKSGHERCVA